jgi:hypothetical protein
MAQLNQCDGCRRGLPLRDGTHSNPDGSYDHICCTAHLYLDHGDQRNWRRIVEEGEKVEYVDASGETVYSGPGSWFETFTSERWCSTCRTWVVCAGILGELRFQADHPSEDIHP